MDRLKKYGFKDENGHPLENCADYLAMFDENKAALEQAEARAEKAEAENARLQQRVNELLSEELTDGAVRERIKLRFNMHEVLQQNERLTKMVDWLAERLGTLHPDCPLKYLKQRPLGWKCHEGSQGPCSKSQAAGCWAEAARRAVADSEVKG